MFTILEPRNGERVTLLHPYHLAYIANPIKSGVGAVDFLDLHAKSAALSAPRTVTLRYAPSVDAEVQIGTRADLSDALCISGTGGVASVTNLLLDTDYFWCVKKGDSASPTAHFHTDATAPRMLAVDGISNVRDFGGFVTLDGRRVRQGLLYRTSEFNSHVTLTERGLETLLSLGIRTDLDIRGAGEAVMPVLPDTVAYHNIPLSAYEHIFTEEQMARYRALFELLADPAIYPAVLHCWGGIDRTGTFLYVLGAMLGMKEADLGLDYEMSSFSIWGDRSRKSEQFRAFLTGLSAYEDSVNAAAVGYLHAAGVNDRTLSRIRDIFLA